MVDKFTAVFAVWLPSKEYHTSQTESLMLCHHCLMWENTISKLLLHFLCTALTKWNALFKQFVSLGEVHLEWCLRDSNQEVYAWWCCYMGTEMIASKWFVKPHITGFNLSKDGYCCFSLAGLPMHLQYCKQASVQSAHVYYRRFHIIFPGVLGMSSSSSIVGQPGTLNLNAGCCMPRGQYCLGLFPLV